MKINKHVKRLAKQYKGLPERVQCLCTRHCIKFPQPSENFPRVVCPRCGGRGYVEKRKEFLRDAVLIYNMNRVTCLALGSAILLIILASVL